MRIRSSRSSAVPFIRPFSAVFILVWIVSLAIASGARAQSTLETSVVSAGGGTSATSEYQLQGTVGLTAPGTLTSGVHMIRGGIWSQVHPPAGPIAIPVVQQDAAATDEDEAVTIRPLDNDTNPAGGSLTIESFSEPANGTVEQTGEGEGELTYTPAENFNGEDTFSYTALNDDGGAASTDVIVTVAPVNDAPVFTSEPLTAGAAGEPYLYEVTAGDVDADELTLSASTLPGWLTFADAGDGTGRLEGSPSNEEAGEHNVVLEVGDASATATQSFTVTVVIGSPAAPALTAPEDGSTDEETDLTLEWSEVAGAASYDVQLAADADFAGLIIDSADVATTSLNVVDLAHETTYFWRVRAVNGAGASDYAGPFRFTTLSNVAAEDVELPEQFDLHQSYPNPFNPSTTIAFELPAAAEVRLVLYDLFGREVMTLARQRFPAGRHEVLAELGSLASGSYFYRIEAGAFRAVRRMLLVK